MIKLTKLILLVLITGASFTQAQETGIGPGRKMPPDIQTKMQSDAQTWSRYTVEREEFSVILPYLPAMTTTRGMRKGDHEYQTQRQLESSEGGVLYIIEVYENPKPQQSLDDFISKRSEDLKCDPAAARSITVDGYSGKECTSADKDHPAIVQVFASEARLYRFLAKGPGIIAPAARQFFSSIRLGKNANGIKVSDGPGQQVFSGKQLDTKPRLLEKPEPSYTEEARANRITGTVILRVVFTSKGTVDNIRVMRELPNGLTERAIEAAKKIKFIPATKDGRPVSMWMQLEYNFWP
jgi:TonB family protein